VRARHLLIAAVVLVLAVVAVPVLFGGDDADDPVEEGLVTTSSTATTLDPDEVLEACTPAPSEDFVAIERHLTNGGHHLGQGFVADQPDGHYLIANLYSIDDQLLVPGALWRLEGVGGAASSVTPETSAHDELPDATGAVAPEALQACLAAAVAAG
jgi:hypothetical protein